MAQIEFFVTFSGISFIDADEFVVARILNKEAAYNERRIKSSILERLSRLGMVLTITWKQSIK